MGQKFWLRLLAELCGVAYMYFEIAPDQCVFHMMGQGKETHHIVMHNEEAVISPS